MTDKTSEKLIIESLLKDRRADRRWKIIRSFVWAAIVIAWTLFIFMPSNSDSSNTTAPGTSYVSLVRMSGEIKPMSSFSARHVIPELNAAFKDKQSKGVVLVINSPGGSPVQASLIHDRILYLKNKYKKKVVIIGEDSLASGAYLVASSADKIFVNNDTLTGSIGVVMSGFGFNDAIEKLGITRRVFTAGTNKDRLDPFKPLTPADATKVSTLLNEVHQHFIENVTQGRGDRLKGNLEELFSGDFWVGSTAVKLGLADGVGNTWTVMKNEFDVTHYKDYTAKPSLWAALMGNVETELHLNLGQKDKLELVSELP